MGLKGFGLFLEQRSKKFKCSNKRRGAVAWGEFILVWGSRELAWVCRKAGSLCLGMLQSMESVRNKPFKSYDSFWRRWLEKDGKKKRWLWDWQGSLLSTDRRKEGQSERDPAGKSRPCNGVDGLNLKSDLKMGLLVRTSKECRLFLLSRLPRRDAINWRHGHWEACGKERKYWRLDTQVRSMELELQAVGRHPMWELGIESGSFERAAGTLNCWVISLALLPPCLCKFLMTKWTLFK